MADLIRHRLRQAGHLTGPEATGPGWGSDDRYYAAGDRLLLHANTYIDGDQVHNGTTGQVTAVDPTGALDVAFDDGHHLTLAPRFVTGTRPDGTPNLSHAWARTIDGAQGGTWDHVHVLAGPSVDRHTLYVGQSRGRHPTHTWNVAHDPNDEAHGNVVTDDRDPDQLVLAAARRPDATFAAWDDPYVLDRQLRDERTEHQKALADGPPDPRVEVASLGRQLELFTRDARHHYDALRRAESLARQTAGPHLRRDKRDRHRQAVEAVQAAADALEATQEQLRTVRAKLGTAQSAQAARERWDQSQQWRHDEIARIDHDLARHWATAVLDATHDGDPLAYGLDHLRDAARTIAADPAWKQDHAVMEGALRSCRVHRVTAIYRGDELPPAHLTEDLGEIPGPGPARAVWAALATRVEHRLDTIGPEPEHERSPVHRQLRRRVQRWQVEPADLMDAADRLPAVDLSAAGPATWNRTLEQATQLHHEQPARVVERGFGLSL